MKWDAFISSSPANAREARSLSRALRRYRIPKGLKQDKSRLSVFLEPPDEPVLSESSREALESASYLVVLCSRAGARDARVDQEIRAFKRLGHPQNILTLILDGEPNAADGIKGFSADDECFPDVLKYELKPDGELDRDNQFEPIAADLRPHKDGRYAAQLKIVAGLLGVGFDDLYHREQRRRQRRILTIGIASLVLAVILALLAVNAFLSYQESQKQLAITREVNAYMQSLFTQVDRPAVQKMDPKLMSDILGASQRDLEQSKPRPDPDVEAQMRQILGQAYLACGIWDQATFNLRRSLDLWEPLLGADNPSSLISRRDLGEALIGAGKYAEARDLLSHTPPTGGAVVRYQLARALALTGNTAGAKDLLDQEIKARPAAAAEAQQDPAFAALRSQLPAAKGGSSTSH